MKFFGIAATLFVLASSAPASAQIRIGNFPDLKVVSTEAVTVTETAANGEVTSKTTVKQINSQKTDEAGKLELELAKIEAHKAIKIAEAEAKAKRPQGYNAFLGQTVPIATVVPVVYTTYGGYYGYGGTRIITSPGGYNVHGNSGR